MMMMMPLVNQSWGQPRACLLGRKSQCNEWGLLPGQEGPEEVPLRGRMALKNCLNGGRWLAELLGMPPTHRQHQGRPHGAAALPAVLHSAAYFRMVLLAFPFLKTSFQVTTSVRLTVCLPVSNRRKAGEEDVNRPWNQSQP